MPITFSCENCKARMTVPDTLAGKRGKCSKCKAAIIVPGSEANGTTKEEVSAHPTESAAARTAVARPPAPARVAPATPPPEPEPPVDLEAEALAALVDAPKEEKKQAEFIEFNCPQCDEPLKLGLDLAGKRHPCPECKRIIAVPVPKVDTPQDWRNTGPKLPAGARRDDGPAPEGAWTGTKRASTEALKEAGVIKEKERPLTFYQKYQTYMLVGTPVVLLLAGALFLWSWMARNQEKRAFDYAMTAAADKNAPKLLGGEGLLAMHGHAGEYLLRTQKPGCASRARDQYGQAVNLGKAVRGSGADALLGDLAVAALALAGGPEETDTDRKLSWKETHRVVRATLEGIDNPQGRLHALRRVTAGLVEHGETSRVLPLVAVVSGGAADRSEALATVGLELLRLGKKDEAAKALAEAIKPFFEKEKPKDKKAKLPLLTAPVVSLAKLEGKEQPKPGKDLGELENYSVGLADALARQGKLTEARAQVDQLAGGRSRLRGLITVGIAAAESKNGTEDLLKAVDEVKPGSGGTFPWLVLQLIETGLAADVPPDKLEPAVAGIGNAGLTAWGQLVLLRARLAKSRSVESVELVEKLPAKGAGGLVARLELARHNTNRNSGWSGNVKSWDEAPRALGSLGIALGMQGGK